MIWLAYLIFAFQVLRFAVSLTNMLTRQWLKTASRDNPCTLRENNTSTEKSLRKSCGNPTVSLLIPARNEETNLGNLLSDLLKQDFDIFEIIR